MKGESSQKPIKIDGKLWDELDEWLQSPTAKTLGFHSKAQFVTQAVRELLEKYTERTIPIPKQIYDKYQSIFEEKKSELESKGITSFSDYVAEMLTAVMERDKSFARYAPKIERIAVDDDRVVLKDNIKNRIAEVVIEKGELVCQLCKEKDCVHVGFVFSLPEVSEVLYKRKIKQPK